MAPLKSHLLTGSTHCSLTGMQATGIPAHLAMANELSAVVSQTQQLKEAVLSRCDELPAALTDVMLSKFTINGALPITVDNMKEMLSTAIAQMRGEMRSELQGLRVDDAMAPGPSHQFSPDPRFQLWTWGERQHIVPHGWTLPSSISLKDTWLLWHFGHIADRIAPLRRLKKFDLNSPAQAVLLSKTKQTMKAVAKVMVEMGMVGTVQGVLTLSEADSAAFFDRAIVRLMEQLKTGVTRGRARWMEMKAPTVYALLLKSRKRRRAEAEANRRGEEEEEKEEAERRMGAAAEEDEGGGDSAAAALLSQLNSGM